MKKRNDRKFASYTSEFHLITKSAFTCVCHHADANVHCRSYNTYTNESPPIQCAVAKILSTAADIASPISNKSNNHHLHPIVTSLPEACSTRAHFVRAGVRSNPYGVLPLRRPARVGHDWVRRHSRSILRRHRHVYVACIDFASRTTTLVKLDSHAIETERKQLKEEVCVRANPVC